MCLIVHRFGDSNLPSDVIDVNRQRNADGFGIAWRNADGTLSHAKYGPQSFGKFQKRLRRIDRDKSIEYTAHFRFATHGAPCRDLSHPFEYTDPIEGKVLVFHNGVINIQVSKGESDTSQFVKTVLSKMPSRWWAQPHLVYLVEAAIGGSRMLLMTATESVYLNEDAWHVKGGLAYSTDPGGSHSKYQSSGKGGATYAYFGGGKGTTTPLLTPVAASIESRSSDTYACPVPASDDDLEPAQSWMHEGHEVENLGRNIERGDDDIEVEALCVQCQTLGTVTVIEGNLFIDVVHSGSVSVEDEDDDEELDYQRWLSGASASKYPVDNLPASVYRSR